LHPRVRDVMQKKIGVLTAPYCIVVIPLLIEANQQSMVDRILVVDAPEELCIQRVVERDNTSKEAARRILAAQVGRKTRLAQASEIIVNDRDIEAVRGNVEQLHNKYLAIAAKTTHRH
jgi:dephospho-CoA kinase